MTEDELQRTRDLMDDLDRTATRFGRTLSASLASGVRAGKDLRGILVDLQSSLASLALRAAFKPVGDLITSGISSLAKSLVSSLAGVFSATGAPLKILPNAAGNAFDGGAVQTFATGGVIASPTYFPMRGGLGLMGERGAEAIMPLARGSDGRLGIRAASGASPPVAITVNIATPDVESFRRSEAQVSAALMRAVGRGRRGI
jgi:phage-related minor tail protein